MIVDVVHNYYKCQEGILSFTTEDDLTETAGNSGANQFINLVFQFVVERAHLLQDLQ